MHPCARDYIYVYCISLIILLLILIFLIIDEHDSTPPTLVSSPPRINYVPLGQSISFECLYWGTTIFSAWTNNTGNDIYVLDEDPFCVSLYDVTYDVIMMSQLLFL